MNKDLKNKTYVKTPLDITLNGLMRRYKQRVPVVQKIINTMIEEKLINNESEIINDHIAFRTMGVKGLGISSLEKIFLSMGYEKRDPYHFEKKKLNAFWYSPPKGSVNLPRLFISECRVNEFSDNVKRIIETYTDTVLSDPVDQLDLTNGEDIDQFLHSPLWKTPTWEEYQGVLAESEYAAWVLYNRYYLNHFTITVSELPTHNTIESFNTFLESYGVILNDAGGKVKISKDGNLMQSATVAEKIEAEFPTATGKKVTQRIAGSYVEFAQRENGREGFEAGNADKIFESTFTKQIDK